MLNVIDLFCGCGGLSLGFEMAGFRIKIGIDNHSSAVESFIKNHKNAKAICADITTVELGKLTKMGCCEKADVIIGGPPCQGLSLSGPRKFQDSRNRLYLSFIKAVETLEPRAFLIENVPGLVSLYKGAIKESIVAEFNRLGYSVEHKTLAACDYGVPQLRKRVFFVGLKNKKKYLFPEGSLKDAGSWITAEQAISDLPLLENSLGIEFQPYPSEPQNDYQVYSRAGSDGIHNHIATNHTDQTKKIISLVPEGGNYKDLPQEYRNSRNFNVAWTRYHSKKPAPTIDTGHRHHFHYKCNRVPTVRESARFQSFPDSFIFYGNKSDQYMQVGNAVPPLLAKALAERLMDYL